MVLSYAAQAARGLGLPDRPPGGGRPGHTLAERFLIRWKGEPDPKHVKAIDAYWCSAAEHGMNASTFTARVITSTGADVAAAFSGAIGAMSGPLHGGAPSRVLDMIEEVERRGDATTYVKELLDKGERLMGFGHRVYRAEDPRARVLRRTARELNAPRYEVAEALEQAALAELANAAPTGCWRPTWSSGRRSSSTSPRSREHVHLDVHLRADRWLVGAHPGAEAHRPADPPLRDLRRPASRAADSVDGWNTDWAK